MSNSGYVTLARQSGLLREMQSVANNLANMSTTGFRSEGLIFAEHIRRLDDAESVSMAHATARSTSSLQGGLTQTGGTYDLAIEGGGFFLIETPDGERLTRAGNFTPNEVGELVTPDGYRLLDVGGAPVFIPPGATVAISPDGAVSSGGQPLTQIGLYQPVDPMLMRREDGVRFVSDSGIEPTQDVAILQGFLEESNVDPVAQITRMIEVQRAYELGQSFLDKEDERLRAVFRTLSR